MLALLTMYEIHEYDYMASHVELTFRDTYLTRADMWRIVVTELVNKSMYKGQKLLFMGTIKAQIRNIYIKGRKVQSAFYGPSTKPIFRSESARYVLFIQMSKEMWDFDTDGTGEIMFHKVINGFLHEIFKRWQDIGAHHLVSIILFTRMKYEQRLAEGFDLLNQDKMDYTMHNRIDNTPYKDFYRVLVSDMASGQWTTIMTQLKKEFKVFLRDVSIQEVQNDMSGNATKPQEIISGRPMAATQGNVLEAINLASSQFAGDYIDRDLVRTGLSIVVITPGTGVFEVEHDLLTMTTDRLVENGIGIDLVCLSRMPLHSVPLFKYRTNIDSAVFGSTERKTSTSHKIVQLAGSPSSGFSALSTGHMPRSERSSERKFVNNDNHSAGEWHYAIPHWIDVSFWTGLQNSVAGSTAAASKSYQQSPSIFNGKRFVPRVRMYEVQMMGIMENEMSKITIPYLRFSSISQSTTSEKPIENEYLGNQQLSSTSKRSSAAMHPAAPQSSANLSSTSISSVQTSISRRYNSLFRSMDEYDKALFGHPELQRTKSVDKARTPSITEEAEKSLFGETKPSSFNVSPIRFVDSHKKERQRRPSSSKIRPQLPQRKSSTNAGGTNSLFQQAKPKNASRQISFGFKGFGGGDLKATPVTEISSETAKSESLLSRSLRSQSIQPRHPPMPFPDENSDRSSLLSFDGQQIMRSAQLDMSDSDERSNPINIKGIKEAKIRPKMPNTVRANPDEISQKVEERALVDHTEEQSWNGLSPRRAMAPWLTVLNPSNPRKTNTDLKGRLGKWHHIFPRPLAVSSMKWKSLCSPASVPLTTEDFPTLDELNTEYVQNKYEIAADNDNDVSEYNNSVDWLMRELISARFSHGFQVVVGSRLCEAVGDASLEDTKLFSNVELGSKGIKIFLSMGSTIHCLSVIGDCLVEIVQYDRRATVSSDLSGQNTRVITYTPAIRTNLAEKYSSRVVKLSSRQQTYDWHRLDTFIASHAEHELDNYPDLLHFWRARFVLIPKEQPSNMKRESQGPTEDNDEEIRLEGIRKLSHVWQKNRYIPPDERRFQTTSRRHKDTNPLDIVYQTRNPSAIVAAELNDTPLLEAEGTDSKATQLIPDSELFERANLNIAALASSIQGERGIKMMDRRWHWRLHYNCFIGMELTTWLLNNFKDIDTREEAIELGSELMKDGLFQHVERRHNFRDGNFFYQISSEYRVPRNESRTSWFGNRRSLQSMPSTPSTETAKGSLGRTRSRSGSNGDRISDGDVTTSTVKQRLGVALSKRLVYDVDPRKRSYRRELIHLHYDKIASADDCYHLRIDWMNVTPKLIEDAIVIWATTAERNGLRLVELPIGEASKIDEIHPFRAPYIVQLAKRPPEKQPLTNFDSTSLTPRGSSSFPYHKALLKKFNFVLDLEAAKDFPTSVDVTYSWGKPDYRYPQYISREGVWLIQITDQGDFLMLANRLFTNRGAKSKDTIKSWVNKTDDHDSRTHRSAAQDFGSPSASPAMRAIPDVFPEPLDSEIVTAEGLGREFETFCKDAKALEAFYDEVLQKYLVSEPVTPLMNSTASGLDVPPVLDLQSSSPLAHREVDDEKAEYSMDPSAEDSEPT